MISIHTLFACGGGLALVLTHREGHHSAAPPRFQPLHQPSPFDRTCVSCCGWMSGVTMWKRAPAPPTFTTLRCFCPPSTLQRAVRFNYRSGVKCLECVLSFFFFAFLFSEPACWHGDRWADVPTAQRRSVLRVWLPF